MLCPAHCLSPLSVNRAKRDSPQIRTEFGELRNVVCNLKDKSGS